MNKQLKFMIRMYNKKPYNASWMPASWHPIRLDCCCFECDCTKEEGCQKGVSDHVRQIMYNIQNCREYY